MYNFPKGVSQFVSRDGPLREVARLFRKRNHDEIDPTVVVLIGMGGSGKTQLALKYCRRSKVNQRFDSIFWVDASNPSSIFRSFANIEELIFNRKVDLADASASAKKVTEQMNEWQTSWLIVFDNFDTPSLFDDEGINFRNSFWQQRRNSYHKSARRNELFG